MNCPTCNSVMFSKNKAYDSYNYSKRINIHCWNRDCASLASNNATYIQCIIQSDKIWKCHAYNLPFKKDNEWLTLEGYNYTDITFIRNNKDVILIDSDFIPISTDDNMHILAKKIFDDLYKYILIK